MKEQIIELRKKGLTLNEIANELGCVKSTVSYHINNVGLGGKINRDKKTWLDNVSMDTINLIKKLRKEGKTYEEIFKLVSISEDKLIKICRVFKINKPVKTHKFDENQIADIIDSYKKLKSLRRVAIVFNTTRDTLRKIIPKDLIGSLSYRDKKITKSEAVINWRKNTKRKLVEYKGGKCERCGYNKCIQALQFHHINKNEKDFQISGKSYSFERMKIEVDKCMLVCANCHIEIHEEIGR